jgi:hypothetical protein
LRKGGMHLYAYPVIFFIFACIDAYGIVVKRRRYAEAFIYKASRVQQCWKRAYRFNLSEIAYFNCANGWFGYAVIRVNIRQRLILRGLWQIEDKGDDLMWLIRLAAC